MQYLPVHWEDLKVLFKNMAFWTSSSWSGAKTYFGNAGSGSVYNEYGSPTPTYSNVLYLPSLRFHCVGGCRDKTHDLCNFRLGDLTIWLDLIYKKLRTTMIYTRQRVYSLIITVLRSTYLPFFCWHCESSVGPAAFSLCRRTPMAASNAPPAPASCRGRPEPGFLIPRRPRQAL